MIWLNSKLNPLNLGEPELVALAGKRAQPGGILGPVEHSQRLPERASAVLAVVRGLARIHPFLTPSAGLLNYEPQESPS